MSTNTTSLRRVVTFISGVAVGLTLLTGAASAATPQAYGKGGNPAHTSANPDNLSPQPASTADFSGNGANVHGSYDSTRDGSPSGNGNGKGEAVGKPCAGCVGKADNKNPKGQAPDGPTDHNQGYECDGNHGIGRSNPAHTGCTSTTGSGGTVLGSTDNAGGSTVNPPASDGTPADSVQAPAVEPTDSTAKPVCAGGQMATDVNGDGVIDGRDCAVVAGVSETRAASAPAIVFAAPAGEFAVMGATAARGVTALPRTGVDVSTSVWAALVFLAAGFALVRKAAPARR